MNRATYAAWCAAPAHAKPALMTLLMRENEPLAAKFARAFLTKIDLDICDLEDDVYQAARIGLMRAIEKWDPARGAFANVAYPWIRYEMQLAVRHAATISYPRRFLFMTNGQLDAQRFYATHGREPTPEEIGVNPAMARRVAEKAASKFVSLDEADEAPAEVPDVEGNLDRARDMRALKTWVGKLSKTDRAEFWKGDRPDLTDRAKAYVQSRRGIR